MGQDYWKGKLSPSDTLDLPIRLTKQPVEDQSNMHNWAIVVDDESIVSVELQNSTPQGALDCLVDKLLSQRGVFD